jgi:acyl carrier protein
MKVMSDDSLARVQEIMRDVFDEDDIVLTLETTAQDVEVWDSLNHIRLIVAIEEDIGIQLPMERVNELRNVGDLVQLIDETKG